MDTNWEHVWCFQRCIAQPECYSCFFDAQKDEEGTAKWWHAVEQQLISNADFFQVWLVHFSYSIFSACVCLESLGRDAPLLVTEQVNAAICWWKRVHLLSHESWRDETEEWFARKLGHRRHIVANEVPETFSHSITRLFSLSGTHLTSHFMWFIPFVQVHIPYSAFIKS